MVIAHWSLDKVKIMENTKVMVKRKRQATNVDRKQDKDTCFLPIYPPIHPNPPLQRHFTG